MELCTKVNGKMNCDMVMERKFGLTEPSMKATGETMQQMVKGNFGMQMGMSMMENG